jgi:hypothetical protein
VAGLLICLKLAIAACESAKQAEIRLAILLKILQIVRFRSRKPWRGRAKARKRSIFHKFRRIWLIHREAQNLLSISQF